MNLMNDPARQKAVATYDAAADHFDAPPLAFWDRHGRRAVALLDLQPGENVLDVGCGTGASAIPAARTVGPAGRVTGLDLAQNMLHRARAKARAAGLDNVTFRCADMAASGLADESVDAVISVFSIFFVPDMERQVAELWRLLRPGGKLAVTVWGPRLLEPGASIFAEEVAKVRPDPTRGAPPWERLTVPDNLRQLFLDGGITEPEIHLADDRQRLSCPEDFWTIALGSGLRREIDQLTPERRKRVRAGTVRRLASLASREVETGAIHAIARKPG